MNDGVFGITTVFDLYKKLEHDYERLKSSPNDAYIAFDFFMTAAHIPDWIEEGDCGKAKKFRKNRPILRICYQLACGGKHFRLKSKEHNCIEKTEKDRYFEEGFVDEEYTMDPLQITLTGNLAEKLGKPNPSSALDLADLAMSFWRSWIAKSGGKGQN